MGIVLLLTIVDMSWAQNADTVVTNNNKNVKGYIYDAVSHEPMIGVTVQSLNNTYVWVTDFHGYFNLEVPDTVKSLKLSYLGYETTLIDATANDTLRIYLNESKGINLKEATIVGRQSNTTISTLGIAKTEKIGLGELMKAACCNLSESFETTPSVDVGFTDAVSGYKQIQMLGLAGTYTSFTRENIPDIRGLAAITGLTFTPGTFVESIQLSKGAGSVVNGFEGTAGQINVEWFKPFEDKSPQFIINGYQSVQGRSEGNFVANHSFNKRLSTSVLLHGRGDFKKVDMNNDKFLDNPLGSVFVGANRWFYFGENGWEIQGGVKAIALNTHGGQFNHKKGDEQLSGNSPWGYQNKTDRIETWAKIGKVNLETPYKSMGLQLSGIYHDQSNQFGATPYNGNQRSFYTNYIYQSIINNTNHIIKMGASAIFDQYYESFKTVNFSRTEIVPGVFTEYSWKHTEKFNLVAGLRADYNNLFGTFVTPRLHIRYAPTQNTAFRASAGRAQRTANFIAENMGLMASSRSFLINSRNFSSITEYPRNNYPFAPEVAWNMGVNFTQKFMLNYRDGTFGLDYYYTDFTNQVVVDIEKFREVNFYNLNGKSYSHSIQAQLDYEPIRFFDVRLAYRFYDVKTTYSGQLLEKPLIASYRAFLNLGFSTHNHWKFDYTVQWMGSKRLPQHYDDHLKKVVVSGKSPSFWLMNTQINKSFNNDAFSIYVGAENLLNVMQHPLIIGASDPFGNNFDASLIWGSAMGRNIYAGFRINIAPKNKNN